MAIPSQASLLATINSLKSYVQLSDESDTLLLMSAMLVGGTNSSNPDYPGNIKQEVYLDSGNNFTPVLYSRLYNETTSQYDTFVYNLDGSVYTAVNPFAFILPNSPNAPQPGKFLSVSVKYTAKVTTPEFSVGEELNRVYLYIDNVLQPPVWINNTLGVPLTVNPVLPAQAKPSEDTLQDVATDIKDILSNVKVNLDSSLVTVDQSKIILTNILSTLTSIFNEFDIALDSIVTNVNNINSKVPNLGQATNSQSVPVVLTASQLSTLTPLSTVSALQSGPWNVTANTGLSQPLTDTQLRASAVPVIGTFFQVLQPVTVESQILNRTKYKAKTNTVDWSFGDTLELISKVTQGTVDLSWVNISTGVNIPAGTLPVIDVDCDSLDAINNKLLSVVAKNKEIVSDEGGTGSPFYQYLDTDTNTITYENFDGTTKVPNGTIHPYIPEGSQNQWYYKTLTDSPSGYWLKGHTMALLSRERNGVYTSRWFNLSDFNNFPYNSISDYGNPTMPVPGVDCVAIEGLVADVIPAGQTAPILGGNAQLVTMDVNSVLNTDLNVSKSFGLTDSETIRTTEAEDSFSSIKLTEIRDQQVNGTQLVNIYGNTTGQTAQIISTTPGANTSALVTTNREPVLTNAQLRAVPVPITGAVNQTQATTGFTQISNGSINAAISNTPVLNNVAAIAVRQAPDADGNTQRISSTIATSLFGKITDGTSVATVRSASSQPTLSDPALVVSVSGNSAHLGSLVPNVIATRAATVAGQYLLTPPVLTNNQMLPLQLNPSGHLKVDIPYVPTNRIGQVNPAADIALITGARVKSMLFSNTSAAVIFLQIHNSVILLSTGAVPLNGLIYRVPANSSLPFTVADFGQTGTLFSPNTRIGLSSTFGTYTAASAGNLALCSLSVELI